MKSFEKWETEEVERTFGIKFKREKESMKSWIAFQTTLSERENETIEELKLLLIDYVDFWNEQDLKVFFIIPIINIIRFSQFEKYRTFMEATFEANLKDVQNNDCALRGRVEMVVATGKQKPQTPFFFLNEYKAQAKSITDPKGQLLIAMLAAQSKNNGLNLPIYGMYNIGQIFFFVILEGNEYTTSKAFDATDQQDLERIVYMLKFVKNHIENFINQLK
ncbi:MAG: hypothetical protein EAZ85_12900 [Bacteroidetes bacterium]|nr:MAG: hypothetical protein EAZ85_12900 [Bacteroidota bacterium]